MLGLITINLEINIKLFDIPQHTNKTDDTLSGIVGLTLQQEYTSLLLVNTHDSPYAHQSLSLVS